MLDIFFFWRSKPRFVPMKVVMGLGNPGAEYQQTRHNAGFLVVDRLAEEWHSPISRRAFQSLVGEGRHAGQTTLLLKPQTFMNLSGRAAREVLRFYHLTPADLLVICDDVNLPLGKLRIRKGGSDGGQNGLKSITQELGTNEFPRLRVGVGRPAGERGLIGHVLGKWEKSEIPVIQEQVDKALEAVKCILEEGVETAMNRFNG